MKEGYDNEFLQNNYIYWTLLTHKIGDFILLQLKMDYVSLDHKTKTLKN